MEGIGTGDLGLQILGRLVVLLQSVRVLVRRPRHLHRLTWPLGKAGLLWAELVTLVTKMSHGQTLLTYLDRT